MVSRFREVLLYAPNAHYKVTKKRPLWGHGVRIVMLVRLVQIEVKVAGLPL